MGARYLRVHFWLLNALARLFGVASTFCGAWGLLTAGGQDVEHRGVLIAASVLALVMGVAFVVVPPATPEAAHRIFGSRIRGDSTDQRGPDEWQA